MTRLARPLLPMLLLLFPVAAPATAQLSPAEARMQAAVAADVTRQEALLQALVDRNSGTLNLPGVRAVGDAMARELTPLGFTVRWVDMAATGRAGHLVAIHRGSGRGRRMLLIGHLDTVFEPDSPFQRYERQGTRAVGPGVGDDKGGLVVIVGALRAMKAAGTLAAADVTIVLTGDEERTGTPLAAARADLVAAGKWADVALEYENVATEDGRDYATVARRGVVDWEVVATGRTGHSGSVFGPDLGDGAAYELARIVDAFRRELREPNATFNVGVMAAGTPAALDADGVRATATGKTNVVAARAVARGDLRTLSPEQDARLRRRMAEIVAAHLPRTDARLVFTNDGYPSMPPSPGNRALLAELNRANRDLGLPEMTEYDPARRGAADSSFVAADADTLAGMGASGGGAHAAGEWIDLSSLPRQSLRSAVLLSRLAAEKR